jgi:hypothetical protein
LRTAIAIFATVFSLAVLPAHADNANNNVAITKAQTAAKAWLTLTDTGKYGLSWDTAAALLKASITKPDFDKALRAARSPLGALKSRTVKSTTFTHKLPGAPDGEYVVIQYTAQFANKSSAIETITPMHEKDGSWRVSGYYIK